jgi:hypothetical protein
MSSSSDLMIRLMYVYMYVLHMTRFASLEYSNYYEAHMFVIALPA